MNAKKDMSQIRKAEGHVLIGVMVLMAIGIILSSGMMGWASNSLSTRRVVESNAKNFYAVERTINAVTAWLQSNSKNMVNAFLAANFSSNFDLGDPSAGDNQGSYFTIPTLVKMAGTNNAVQLTNSSYFGTSAFPTTTNIDSGATFDAVSEFAAADFGTGVNARILMVWALSTDGNYEPIFRVDATSGGSTPDRGVHGLNFIRSALVSTDTGVGYYADVGDFATQTPNNQCWSYQYTWNGGTSTWTRGAPRSNCLITGADDMQIKSAIHGSVSTNKLHGIALSGGSISGSTCEGPGCVSYTLPVNPDWDSRCGGVPAVDITVSSTPYSLPSGSALSQQCYRNVHVNSNKTLVFATADQPYYIKNLTLQNNSNSKLNFPTVGPGHKYTIYMDNFADGQINGNQLVSTNLAPNQLEIYLTKDTTLILNGTASMHGIITGTNNTTIRHNGNFTFFGAYRANALDIKGNATLGYDEGIEGVPTVSDINFTLYKASQRYR